MNKNIIALLFLLVATSVCAKTLRVSNVKGSTAPYSTVYAAMEDAEDGDVIMVDASPDSYGNVTITKSVTLQGPGFGLVANGIAQEGQNTAYFSLIDIKQSVEGVKISSLSASRISAFSREKPVITRCRVNEVNIIYSNGAVLHQNYIRGKIICDKATNAQITNNIIRYDTNASYLDGLKSSIVKYNTFLWSSTLYKNCNDCVMEYNIGNFPDADADNTVRENKGYTVGHYDVYETDADIKVLDQELSTSHGAFAGDDPYRISGVSAGPVIEDIDVPASVEQGSDLKVKVTIGTKK